VPTRQMRRQNQSLLLASPILSSVFVQRQLLLTQRLQVLLAFKFSQFLISLEQIQTFTELDQVFYLNVRVSLVPSLFFGYGIIVKYFRTHEFLFIFPNLLPFSSKSQKRSKKKSQKFEQSSLNHKKRHLKFSMTSRSSRSTKALM
jgi:hypothetical protein